ncbi:hypothetical protein Cgig2_011173 [Carnegiea gigantea]|uniref:Ubiquitin-like protease family profile domain-containing protein n=1 Tax=Carnegiea gigantea TaxID=171969 RepID=A0A9Q1GKW8_9CARY|nr:hypothetical protein Cgig2_011173 [Carnegiea gigantea]
MEKSTHNVRKVQLFGAILEDKGASVACKGNCEQRNSLEARMNFIENLVVKVSSAIILLTSIIKENSDALKMLNANVNRLMKHVVDNETTKLNKHMTNTCATTYIAHPSKSSEKKESPMQFENADEMVTTSTPHPCSKQKRRIVAKHNFSKDGMRAANELTKSISVGGLNFLHKEDKKVNVNKIYIPMNDRAVHCFLIVVDLQCRHVALLKSLPLNKSNDFRRELAKDLNYLTLQF